MKTPPVVVIIAKLISKLLLIVEHELTIKQNMELINKMI